MMTSQMERVSPHALVAGKLGPDCEIGPFAIIGDAATLGEGCIVHPHAVIGDGVDLGAGVEVFASALIGKEPKGAGATARQPEFSRRISIGAGSSIGPHTTIYYDVEIGEQTLIGDGASIREQGRIGSRCIVSRCVTLNYDVLLGNNAKIMDNTHVTGHTVIEDDVFVADGVSMANDNSPTSDLAGEEERLGGPHIERGATVGAGAILLPGVRIGTYSIVAAGAVVTRSVEPHTRVAGIPARPF
jgi:acetyltransferase-like isoleucine patch superfamily enzyme